MTSRRDFLSSLRKPLAQNTEVSPLSVRPPYGLNESLFQSECVTCDSKACVASCDEKIILLSENGIPVLDFSKSGCTFCEACADVCEPNVLSLAHVHSAERLNATFQISTQACVAHHGVICFSCKEPCIDDAILFNGMFSPVIDDDKCSSCGFCLARCPADAITYTPKPMVEKMA
ncbi:ferredoxin-type protein NapF [Sulfurovum sp.]|uniref:ferredoxin-type protein NapF n=1 Tax=Sulfurovum sp. TaxID=1969726 RepID=UPI0025D4D43A|nr:ferredoxin-type protein NapF [Sulfurovum sp.]